ncbi:MAG: rRNA pseudouridine synthase [Firmicutes bacterium]|nr:rRNA pseudouridine synthase [Bacillota bacterium]MBR3212287.1 rRNA pseudouridine synthase [Bacillota bacterium]
MRINKYIAASGIASRRKADELIKNGNVRVNGTALTEPGYEVADGDVVEVNGTPVLPPENKVYILLNKPVGYVTTVKDEGGRPTVMDLVTEVEGRVFPVGRLDVNTSGMLIMTNDGDFAYRVAHPKHKLGKTYRVRVAGIVTRGKLDRLRKGVDIGGFVTSPAEVEIVKELPKETVLEITIHEGKNRQVRKMCKAIDCPVRELERIAIGPVKIGRLATGGYRKLTRQEIDALMGKKQTR